MNTFRLFILFCTVSTLFLEKCNAQSNREKALWAIAATEKALKDLTGKINEKLTEQIFEVTNIEQGKDLNEEQLKRIKLLVNRIKLSLFNVPTCLTVQDFSEMEKDKFKSGQALAVPQKP